MVDAIAPSPSDTFLEIGPGRGALTLPLAARAGRIVAVEIDRDLAAELATAASPTVRIVTGDFLDIDVPSLLEPAEATATPRAKTRVAGNLPYNASSPILFRLLDLQRRLDLFADATLMMQREVADRLLARPGTGEYGVLSVLVQLQADVARLLTLPPGAFRPPPKVTSTLLRLAFRRAATWPRDPALFEAMVRSMFTQRRKTLANALRPFAEARGRSAGEALAEAGIAAGRRPETLELAELVGLAELFASDGG